MCSVSKRFDEMPVDEYNSMHEHAQHCLCPPFVFCKDAGAGAGVAKRPIMLGKRQVRAEWEEATTAWLCRPLTAVEVYLLATQLPDQEPTRLTHKFH